MFQNDINNKPFYEVENISIIKNLSIVSGNTSLIEIFKKIKGTAYKPTIEQIRHLVELGDKEKADNMKKTLAAFTGSGTFLRRRTMDCHQIYSHYLVLDIDKIDKEDLSEIRSKIQSLAYTLLCFLSPSGVGLKFIVRVDSYGEDHKVAYKQVIEYYTQRVNIQFDEKTNDITRLCFLSHDPDIYMNTDSEVFHIEVNENGTNDTALISEQFKIENDGIGMEPSKEFEALVKYTDSINEFKNGNRNNYIFSLACNCNRMGIDKNIVLENAIQQFGNEFAQDEITRTICSSYDKYKADFGKTALKLKELIKELEETKSIDVLLEELPFIPDSVVDNLPSIITVIAERRESKRERDVIILTLITLLSGSMYNVYGIFDENVISPTLYSFVIAPAASGKGVMNKARKLFNKLEKVMEEEYKAKIDEYYKKFPEREDLEDDKERPVNIQLFIPGNSSIAAIFNHLKETNGIGIICESEADAMGTIFKNEWGNFSYLLRCAFHQEQASINRIGGNRRLIINSPKLSICLTGTPAQVSGIINSAEDGLFSRFIYYLFAVRKWRNPFHKKDNSDFRLIERLVSFEIMNLINGLKDRKIEVCLTNEQQTNMNKHFENQYNVYSCTYLHKLDSTLKRLPLICFRLCMILTAIRMHQENINDSNVECNDIDYDVSIALTDVLLKHAAFMYGGISKDIKLNFKNNQLQDFYECLPEDIVFSRADAIAAAKEHGLSISEKTVYLYLTQLLGKDGQGLIEKLGHGKYRKKPKE